MIYNSDSQTNLKLTAGCQDAQLYFSYDYAMTRLFNIVCGERPKDFCSINLLVCMQQLELKMLWGCHKIKNNILVSERNKALRI